MFFLCAELSAGTLCACAALALRGGGRLVGAPVMAVGAALPLAGTAALVAGTAHPERMLGALAHAASPLTLQLYAVIAALVAVVVWLVARGRSARGEAPAWASVLVLLAGAFLALSAAARHVLPSEPLTDSALWVLFAAAVALACGVAVASALRAAGEGESAGVAAAGGASEDEGGPAAEGAPADGSSPAVVGGPAVEGIAGERRASGEGGTSASRSAAATASRVPLSAGAANALACVAYGAWLAETHVAGSASGASGAGGVAAYDPTRPTAAARAAGQAARSSALVGADVALAFAGLALCAAVPLACVLASRRLAGRGQRLACALVSLAAEVAGAALVAVAVLG